MNNITMQFGVVMVSTGVLKLEKLSVGDTLTHKNKYKR